MKNHNSIPCCFYSNINTDFFHLIPKIATLCYEKNLSFTYFKLSHLTLRLTDRDMKLDILSIQITQSYFLPCYFRGKTPANVIHHIPVPPPMSRRQMRSRNGEVTAKTPLVNVENPPFASTKPQVFYIKQMKPAPMEDLKVG